MIALEVFVIPVVVGLGVIAALIGLCWIIGRATGMHPNTIGVVISMLTVGVFVAWVFGMTTLTFAGWNGL